MPANGDDRAEIAACLVPECRAAASTVAPAACRRGRLARAALARCPAMKIEDLDKKAKIWLAHEPSFDASRFDKCMENGQGADSVRTDEAVGRQLGVEATPTLFVNETILKGLHTADRIREEIRKNLKRDASNRASVQSLAAFAEGNGSAKISGRCGSGVHTTNRQ